MKENKSLQNLRYALRVCRYFYHRGNYDVCLEIPAFLIPPEDYNDFCLSILNPWESSLNYIRIINPKEIVENHVRLRIGEQVGQFDLAADNFSVHIINFISS
jgi:hypothetical protein